jgi:hypothetical protein
MDAVVLVEGNRHKFTQTFEALDGNVLVPTDPTSITWYRKTYDGSATPVETWVYGTDAEVVKEGVGIYSIELDFPVAGSYAVGAQGTGTCYAYSGVRVVVSPADAKHP